jgi:SAM-dependent methyltransferase
VENERDQLLAHWAAESSGTGAYVQFENYFRGSAEALAGRIEEYEDLVRHVKSLGDGSFAHGWLDLGAGRGSLLEVLEREGVAAYGVEQDPALAALASSEGRKMYCGAVDAILQSMISRNIRFSVVSALHIIEHFSGEEAEELIDLMTSILAPGGLCIVVTPNAKSLPVMLGSFYRDPTHVRPYPEELLEFMFASRQCDIRTRTSFGRFITASAAPSPGFFRLFSATKKRLGGLRKGFQS